MACIFVVIMRSKLYSSQGLKMMNVFSIVEVSGPSLVREREQFISNVRLIAIIK